AGTKWNFLKFRPGLVGGHCIGVDPYYLTMKAQQLGYQPEVILAGRRINDGMGVFIAQRLVKLLAHADRPIKGAKVGVLGLTFKEDVSDLRNSKVPDIIRELGDFGMNVLVHDPVARGGEAEHEYGLSLSPLEALTDLDALVLAVGHRAYADLGIADLAARVSPGGAFVDVKALFEPALPALRARDLRYWSL
ncbi:MAG: nucleotide sugar dehydrogenase, partial [Myxococcales bacterium]|nr:nucleotide sugar dehydrogenase [Myxococcales bacterium]